MATATEARHALEAALATAGLDVLHGAGDPPYVRVFPGQLDPERIVSGSLEGQQRTVVVGGGWDSEVAADRLDDLTSTVLTAIRGLPGYRLVSIGPAQIVNDTRDRRVLAREVISSALVTI